MTMLSRICLALVLLAGVVGCSENAKASAACTGVGPGAGATDKACSKCCTDNGAVGRHSDDAKCICIGGNK